ncbi:MAG: uptake hydrogenase small subunit, partial [Aquificota bacterium]|nr:uptake hydrogenase small subunit [Aquificota bacterium]MDQ7083219.1 uptake hydrogenase small subunit [Aquificota bacterium]
CIGCSEKDFWDKGPFYRRLSGIPVPGQEADADKVGAVAVAAAAGGALVHGILSKIRNTNKKEV